jgi:DNA end-binding protein Ku
MTADWTPEKYKDDYREALMKWIDEKVKKGDQFVPQGAPEQERVTADVINLMDVLKRSVERTEKERKAKEQGAKTAHTTKGKGQKSKRAERRV